MKQRLDKKQWRHLYLLSLWVDVCGVVAESLCLGGCGVQQTHPRNIADVVRALPKIGLHVPRDTGRCLALDELYQEYCIYIHT